MASLDTLIYWDAAANVPPATNAATFDTVTNTTDAPDTVTLVLDFDGGSTNEYAMFKGVMPGQYDGSSPLEVVLRWISPTTTGDVKWDVSFKSVADTENPLATKAFAAIQTVTTTVDGTANDINTSVIDFTFAQADSTVKGETFWLLVERDASDTGADTLADDASLIDVELRLN